jgi:hypothetical protein
VELRKGADKSLAFPIFLFAAQPKEFFLDGLKKLEQQSHKCVELRGELKTKKLNLVALVRKRTIPTERPPLVGEVSAILCG